MGCVGAAAQCCHTQSMLVQVLQRLRIAGSVDTLSRLLPAAHRFSALTELTLYSEDYHGTPVGMALLGPLADSLRELCVDGWSGLQLGPGDRLPRLRKLSVLIGLKCDIVGACLPSLQVGFSDLLPWQGCFFIFLRSCRLGHLAPAIFCHP